MLTLDKQNTYFERGKHSIFKGDIYKMRGI